MTESPCSMAAVANSRPKPRDMPLMNQTFDLGLSFSSTFFTPFPLVAGQLTEFRLEFSQGSPSSLTETLSSKRFAENL